MLGQEREVVVVLSTGMIRQIDIQAINAEPQAFTQPYPGELHSVFWGTCEPPFLFGANCDTLHVASTSSAPFPILLDCTRIPPDQTLPLLIDCLVAPFHLSAGSGTYLIHTRAACQRLLHVRRTNALLLDNFHAVYRSSPATH